MGQTKKILVSVPENLLREVEEIVALEKRNRSEFIRESMRLYIREKNKIKVHEQMKKGYEAMAKLNLMMAEDAIEEDGTTLSNYESILSESE
jgi:CopG family transcriptional regulator/antitoxin EndoAI